MHSTNFAKPIKGALSLLFPILLSFTTTGANALSVNKFCNYMKDSFSQVIEHRMNGKTEEQVMTKISEIQNKHKGQPYNDRIAKALKVVTPAIYQEDFGSRSVEEIADTVVYACKKVGL